MRLREGKGGEIIALGGGVGVGVSRAIVKGKEGRGWAGQQACTRQGSLSPGRSL